MSYPSASVSLDHTEDGKIIYYKNSDERMVFYSRKEEIKSLHKSFNYGREEKKWRLWKEADLLLIIEKECIKIPHSVIVGDL